MADDTVRLDVAFAGPQMLSVVVPVWIAEEIEGALGNKDEHGTWSFDAADGRYTIALGAVLYIRRSARETRVGFGS